jgi:hypothetical protein
MAFVWGMLRDGGLIEGTVIAIGSFYSVRGGGLCTWGRIHVDCVAI